MIIQCDKCRTKFNIDDGLIKDSDLKVKCSRCKHVFQVQLQDSDRIEIPRKKTGSEKDIGEDVQKGVNGFEEDWDFDEEFEEESMEDIDALEAVYGEDFEGFFKESPDGALEIDSQKLEDQTTPAKRGSEQKKFKGFRIPAIILFVIVILAGAGYAVFRWSPDLISSLVSRAVPEKTEKTPSIDDGGSRLAILTVDGSFVDSPKAGRLFVVHGKVVNKYSTNRRYLRVKASILDDAGQIVQEKSAYAGYSFVKEALVNLTPEEIEACMEDRLGDKNSNLNISPDTSLDFSIVFKDLPDNVSHFEVEPVSSSPVVSEPVEQP